MKISFEIHLENDPDRLTWERVRDALREFADAHDRETSWVGTPVHPGSAIGISVKLTGPCGPGHVAWTAMDKEEA